MSHVIDPPVEPRADAVPLLTRRCRNCGESAPAQFCPACGQETRESLPTFREFMRDAMGRLVAFDGRLWRTLHALAFRPGFLTRAYLAGVRRKYVLPARLFLAMSLILFAVVRFEIGTPDLSRAVIERTSADDEGTRAGVAKESANAANDFELGLDKDFNVVLRGGADTFVGKQLQQRFERFNRLQPTEKARQIVDGALRYGSYVAFLLLPLFAALQLASYLGAGRGPRERPRLYAEHLVYAAHLHAFGFMMVTLVLVAPYGWLRWLLLAWSIYYVVQAKRVVYGGPTAGRLLRTLAVFFVYALALGAATIGLVLVAVLWR
jgi:Protein of unknown function (DUF3667)